MQAYKCDRCGKLYETNTFVGLKMFGSAFTSSGRDADLCPDCVKELDDWWHKGKQARDVKAPSEFDIDYDWGEGNRG